MSDYYKLVGRDVIHYDTFEAYLADLKEEFERPRHVGDTHVKHVRISTVFLGLDHQFGSGGPPMIFETMVFGGQLADAQERCSTYEEAEAMHARWVRAVQEAERSELEKAVWEVRDGD